MKSLNFQKLNLRKEDILSKTQMKNILGGYSGGGSKCPTGSCDYEWTDHKGVKHTTAGFCKEAAPLYCYCSNGVGDCSIVH